MHCTIRHPPRTQFLPTARALLFYLVANATVLLVLLTASLGADWETQSKDLQMRGDWQGLRGLATDWTKAEPSNAGAWIYLGIADDQLGRSDDAVQAYERGLALDPKLVTGWMYLAADYHKLGRVQKLADVVAKLQGINPNMAIMLQSEYAADLQASHPGTTGSDMPSGLPQKAAAALAQARQWSGDAELMIVDINDYANNGRFQVAYYIYAPSTGTGLIMNDGGSMPVGAANWGKVPIPSKFLDLPAAVALARVQGMRGAFNKAKLQVGDHGLTWIITPTVEASTVRDPFMRSGAFEVPAGGK